MKRQHPDNPDLFWCSKCKQYKAKEEFYTKRSNRNVINGYCRECVKRQVRNIVCHICGKSFLAKGTTKYCGDECRKVAEKSYLPRIYEKKIAKICVYCGEEYRAVRSNQKYCNRHCASLDKYHGNVTHKQCVCCGKDFIVQGHNSPTKTCSKECYKKQFLGEKVPVKCPICNKERMLYKSASIFSKGGISNIKVCGHCHSLEAARVRRKTKGDNTLAERNKRKKEQLTDGYVRGRLKMDGHKIITAELIELKREAMVANRIMKDLKSKIKDMSDDSCCDIFCIYCGNKISNIKKGHKPKYCSDECRKLEASRRFKEKYVPRPRIKKEKQLFEFTCKLCDEKFYKPKTHKRGGKRLYCDGCYKIIIGRKERKNESNYADVSGVKRSDEANHERVVQVGTNFGSAARI
jgi:hypothetical protein